MGVKDPEKNRLYVAKHRAMKKENEETKKEYNALNASYIANHRFKQHGYHSCSIEHRGSN